jgi:hypothetical protein
MRVVIPVLAALLFSAGATLAVVYVDRNAPGPSHDGSSWDAAFLTIQAGVDAATPGDEVWVADGNYAENVVMGEGVQLYGGFLGAEPGGYETGLSQRDFANHVAAIDGHQAGSCVVMATGARVDGFALTNGSGTAYDGSRYGGGFYCDDVGRSAVIANNTITGNSAAGGGAVGGRYSSPTIESNTLTSNSATCGGAIFGRTSFPSVTGNIISGNLATYGGAIYCTRNSYPTIADNTIAGNSADYGGALYCRWSLPAIANNAIRDNSAHTDGGAIYCRTSFPSVTGNIISGNSAGRDGGAAYCCGDSEPWPWRAAGYALHSGYVISGNMIVGNSADRDGGAICYDDASPRTTNNTIAGNRASHDGGGLHCGHESSPHISNNIIAESAAGDGAGGGIWCDSSSFPTLTCNDVWANVPEDYFACEPGAGDISADPLYADPENGDYHLAAGSPCIDAGDNSAPGLPYQDYEGDPRVCDGNGDADAVVDIGADEYLLQFESNAAPAGWFVPGWVWFSVPLIPRWSAEASDVLGFNCANRLYLWEEMRKAFLLYPLDFSDLIVGRGYLARLAVGEEYRPTYEGSQPQLPFERLLPAAGRCWVGVPGTQDIRGLDLIVERDGVSRTPRQDRSAADPWLSWSWIFWDAQDQTAKIMDPLGGGDDEWLHPWWGYLVWVNVGAENVTIIFP